MVHMLTLMHRRVLAMEAEVAQRRLGGARGSPCTGPAPQAGAKASPRSALPQYHGRQDRYCARSEGE